MNKKPLFLTNALLLIFLISPMSASAYYPYLYDYGLHLQYHYYENHNSYPTITGPFPRYYLFHKDMNKDIDFVHDDFNNYDEFIGYKDLDLFYPEQGVIEVIRNPSAREADWDTSFIPEDMQTFGKHVYGYIPGPSKSWVMYRKHYHHEHPWDLSLYEYGLSYYSAPFLAYRNKPVYRKSCQLISPCEYKHCLSCSTR